MPPKEQEKEDPRLTVIRQEVLNDLDVIAPHITSGIKNAIAEKMALKIWEETRKREEVERKNETLQTQLDHDPYNPDIYSKKGWQRAMKDWLRIVRRDNKKAVLIAGDLDGFKNYNDLDESHIAGNRALGLTGQLIKSVVRPNDLVARIHGDEYVVCAETDLEGGAITAHRIRESIEPLSRLLETNLPLSLSVGVIELDRELIETDFDSDEKLNLELDRYYGLADRAMYRGSKQVGKNRVGVVTPHGQVATAVIIDQGNFPQIIYQAPSKI